MSAKYGIDLDFRILMFMFPETACTSFPGPGSHYYATFNPMKEFVHPIHDAHVGEEFDRY